MHKALQGGGFIVDKQNTERHVFGAFTLGVALSATLQ